ncbi:DUF2927 domain-containing protein [Planktotalea arctica]|uniref:DUF2927 domain-containing protein n=1 Tax=Planktotalea arctica TaxID=1481893 RepID=UPI003218E1FE
MIWRALLLWGAFASAVQAQEYLRAETALSDAQFYRLVSCAAPPGGTCQKPVVRWRKNDLSVGITRMDAAYLGGKKKRAEAALVRAIQEINAAGSAIRLTRNDTAPDIPILFLDMPARGTIQNSGFKALDGRSISAAGVRVFTKDGMIEKSVIIFTTGLQMRAYESAMLEEITQGLGLLTDIGGSYYESRSIFSQTSNARVKLGTQDIMALGRHYPAR